MVLKLIKLPLDPVLTDNFTYKKAIHFILQQNTFRAEKYPPMDG